MVKKRLRIRRRLSKRDPGYWRQRLFKNAFTYQGRKVEVRSWSVKIQRFGRRKSFTLSSPHRAQAAAEACRIYQTIIEQGWEAVAPGPAGKGPQFRSAAAAPHLPAAIASGLEYWKRRLIHRKYPDPARVQREREFSVRIEQSRRSHYFPLGTGDENEAAARAMSIYRTVVEKGWASANARYSRELSVALRWQDNPLAWTYTTIHTHQANGPPKPVPARAGRPLEHRVVFIEPDEGIRLALAACANHQAGFRCDVTFADCEAARHNRLHFRVDLALVNHDLLDEPGVACLKELQHVRPELAVLSYSVFEDTDELFKSTPGGSVVYMLNRTSPLRIFEPIAEVAGPPTREQIASCVRKYFQQLSALLPSGPPFWQLAKLTPREHEILAFLSKGNLVKEIADTLGISNWTVQGHIKSIFEKLNVHNRTEAVIKYLHK